MLVVRKLLTGCIALAVGLVLFASFAPSSTSAPRIPTVHDAAINPLALMTPTPRDLPIERFDIHPLH